MLDKMLCGILVVTAFSGVAFAQQIVCPEGYAPTGGMEVQGCAPIPGFYGSSDSPPNPGPSWANRWGAIAVDSGTRAIGTTERMSSKRKARKAALQQCRMNGGKGCKVTVDYYNQCGAVAFGDTRYTSHRGPDRQDTIQSAMQSCMKETTNCDIPYSGCSYPERIR
jgi:Domain of unknown function (DUF4189)